MIRTRRNARRGAQRGSASRARDTAEALGLRIDDLARDLLGEPRRKTRMLWRWGAHDSLAVNVAGERRGRWYSFEQKRGGDALDLIAWAQGTDVKAALAFARAWLGGTR